ncbi:hypothetical protein FOZ62_003775, partial [Perkinsus olseni]
VLSPLSYMLSIFYMIFGLTLLAVEVAPSWFLSEAILRWASFLGTLIGRGLVYLYIGLLYVTGGAQNGVTSWTYLIIGIYLLLLAIANFVVGYVDIQTVQCASVASVFAMGFTSIKNVFDLEVLAVINSASMAGPQSSTIGAQSFTPGERPQSTGFKARVQNMWGKVTEGDPVYIRILGTLAAIGIIVVSILSCFNFANSVLNPLTYILIVFYLIFGIILCFIEIMPSSGVTNWFVERAAFLGTLTGRGLLYLYLGLLFIGGGSQNGASSWAYIVLGIYLVVIAIIFMISGWRLSSNRAAGSLPNSRV